MGYIPLEVSSMERFASIASKENPLYWPERDFEVYFLDGAWFYQRPGEQGMYIGWHRASPDFVRDVEAAYKNFELRAN
jgi:hypothetical protein